jgi:hypothetical protein
MKFQHDYRDGTESKSKKDKKKKKKKESDDEAGAEKVAASSSTKATESEPAVRQRKGAEVVTAQKETEPEKEDTEDNKK